MTSFTFQAFFPGNIEIRSEHENNFETIKDICNQIDWKLTFETAQKCWDNHIGNVVTGNPYLRIINNENKHQLTFTVATNEQLQWKILVSYNWQQNTSSFLGLITKKASMTKEKLLESTEEFITIIEVFGNHDYEKLKQ